MESRWIWPFELQNKLGEGGMGVVYRARYVGNNRQVAVKLIPPEVAANQTLLARFERELEVLKQLRHPNIVRCFGGTCESDQRFYAMELIEGGTLADVLAQRGYLPWETAVDYAVQMCDALQYAHERGVIHRDIKPGNFLLTKTGQIKLSDFGLATVVSAQRLTAVGRTLGTVLYMSPEQIRGKPPLTNRSDLYALGCVMFEMLTGQPPYVGESSAEVLQGHLKEPIPHVAAEMITCPLELDQLVWELLSKDVEQRPATAAEVGRRLEEILQPGRRVSPVEPNLFSTPTLNDVPISPLKGIKRVASDAEIVVSPNRPWMSPLPLAGMALLLMICTGFWTGWSLAAARLRHAEQMWVDLFEQPDVPTRLLAARSLGKFGPLRAETIGKLRDAARDANPEIRVAALKTLGQHAAQSRSLHAEILRIQKVDENPQVTYQAGLTIEALKQAHRESTTPSIVPWTIFLTIVGGFVAAGWWIWQRVKPFA